MRHDVSLKFDDSRKSSAEANTFDKYPNDLTRLRNARRTASSSSTIEIKGVFCKSPILSMAPGVDHIGIHWSGINWYKILLRFTVSQRATRSRRTPKASAIRTKSARDRACIF